MNNSVKAYFEDGNMIHTDINGSSIDVITYYLGKYFNFGIEGDDMQRCIKADSGGVIGEYIKEAPASLRYQISYTKDTLGYSATSNTLEDCLNKYKKVKTRAIKEYNKEAL